MPLGKKIVLSGTTTEEKPSSKWSMIFTLQETRPDPVTQSLELDVPKDRIAEKVADDLITSWNSSNSSTASKTQSGSNWEVTFDFPGYLAVDGVVPTIAGLTISIA